jgi:hypothetical protein
MTSMLSHTEIREVLRQQPFEPFRIEVSDGTTYDIRHPDMVLPTYTALHIGIPGKEGYERAAIVSLVHVVKLMPLTENAKK